MHNQLLQGVVAVEGITIQNGLLISLSEQQQFLDCDQNDRGCDGGFMPRAFEYIMQNGLLIIHMKNKKELAEPYLLSQLLLLLVKRPYRQMMRRRF